VRKSVMPKDKELNLPIVLICIVRKRKGLRNIEGIIGRAMRVNVFNNNEIQVFSATFHSEKKRGFDVFRVTACFEML